MRFIIHYLVGQSKRTEIIEAQSDEEATQKANERHPTWTDIYFPKSVIDQSSQELIPVGTR